MNTPSDPVQVKVTGPRDVVAVIPHLLGFHPETSIVIAGMSGAQHWLTVLFRYDLPDPPDPAQAGLIADHAITVLRAQNIAGAIAVGYGPGRLVTPVADVLRQAFPAGEVRLHDVLRVDDGRYWSYLCLDTACCPPGGVPVDAAHPASMTLAVAGISAAPSRAALAATIAPVIGPEADVMRQATADAERAVAAQAVRFGLAEVEKTGLAAVRAAIARYRCGGSIDDPGEYARLTVWLLSMRIRDDAWARMDPRHRDAHLRLWTDVTRRACPRYVAAPASLLAFTAWQNGDGALANLAIDRAFADDPRYSMARLVRQALDAGLPPSAATLPMTPEQVAASYDESTDRDR